MQGDFRGGHGSCMLSKIGGARFGTAKRITPVLTTMNYNLYINENFLDGLSRILDDVDQNQNPNQPDSVINISINWVPAANLVTNAFIQRIGLLIQELIARGVPVITGSGNSPGLVNGYPALFRDPTTNPHIPELLVVGGVDIRGLWWPSSRRADYVTVYAPGWSSGGGPAPGDPTAIQCASSDLNTNGGTGIVSIKDGTSLCKCHHNIFHTCLYQKTISLPAF